MRVHSYRIWSLAIALAAAAPLVQAAEASVGVRTYAQDAPALPAWDEDTASGRSSQPPAVSFAVNSIYGDSSASAQGAADARTGALKAKFSAMVAGDRELVGRGATANGALSLVGDINIVGAAPSGVATFNALLGGVYATRSDSFNSTIGVNYSFQVGTSPEFNGRLDYSRGAGTFSIPFTWTQTVHPGDVIGFSAFMRASVTAALGVADLDVLNTFKITGVDLPPGYSFTPDADGFLSQFGVTPVPEPATAVLFAAGLLLVGWARRRDLGAAVVGRR
jgi:hypothetical protein